MVFVESNRFGSREEREQTLGKRMGRVGEEGQISDRELIQEISKDEYKSLNRTVPLQAATVTGASSASMAADSRERYWMRDLYKYSYPRSYAASGLHNLAWAQAVQNKPLNEVLVEFKGDDNLTRSLGPEEKNESNSLVGSQDNGSTDASGDQAVNEGPAADSEMEEGELEEGEIDFDSEPGKAVEQEIISSRLNVNRFDTEMDDGELETQVESIRKMLYNVNEIEAQKSFDIACARLKSTLEDLRELVLRTWFPSKDSLIQQSFAAVQCVYSVFCSMSAIQKEQSRNKMTSLLEFLMSFSTGLFTREQKKEIEAMVASNSSLAGPLQTKCSKSQEELAVTDKAILTDSNSLAVDTSHNFDSLKNDKSDVSGGVSGKKDINMLPDVLKPLQSIPKGRSGFGPLLDLHKVHDEDSLPSPTSKTPPSLLGNLPGSVGMFKPESAPVHPYETDAVKAVSTYQQKFGRSTFMSHDRLPSPTPSEECSGGGADDFSEEVSSYFTAINTVKTVTQPVLPQRSSTPSSSISPVQGSVSGSSTAAPSGALHNPSLRGSAKSRDPRLRYRNLGSSDLSYSPLPLVSTPAPKLEPLGEIMKPEKQKTPEVPILDGPALKKPRNGLEAMDVVVNAKDIQTTAGSSGSGTRGVTGPQLINRSQLGSTATDPRKSESWGVSLGMTNPSVSVSASRQCAVSIGNTASLQSLLKDIAVNPAAWINILKEQKRSGEPAENTTHPVTSSSILGAVPLPNVVPPSSSGVGQRATGLVQVPSQIAAVNLQDESTKIRMKPRDPRRVLHTNTIQKSGSSGVEPPKTNGFPVATFQGVQDHKKVSGTDTSAAPSQAPFSPDIAKQLANNLKNIAEIISAPQTLPVPPPMLAQGSSQAMLVNLDRVNVRSGEVPNSSDRLNRSGLRPGEVDTGHPQSHSTWGDVEHLFEGYDDQQIAAIQQERSRRIEEQKKMFAARKLCLVLDLDHTLLNSAKFSEVDPIHDEILRKKEEQDREKPQRHLFRFPHMQMWTKLRPGIWNFLEKASKLYELHLYTMGNKLYATEMARVLDPKGNLFAGRVISRGGDGDVFDGDDRVPRSKDLEGVLGMESAVVIIDDSVRVWPHNKLNLIVVERYTYFPCSRRQFGLPGPSLLEIDHDERPEDGTLASSLSVIERIHQNFFSHKSLDEVDVRNILASEQQKILAGCRIVFSRVFPVGEASPHLHPLWQTAEQFGAVCTNQIDEQVTHVVANSHGTDKVNWALSTGRYVVHPGWVEASALLYRRANEQNFAIKP